MNQLSAVVWYGNQHRNESEHVLERASADNSTLSCIRFPVHYCQQLSWAIGMTSKGQWSRDCRVPLLEHLSPPTHRRTSTDRWSSILWLQRSCLRLELANWSAKGMEWVGAITELLQPTNEPGKQNDSFKSCVLIGHDGQNSIARHELSSVCVVGSMHEQRTTATALEHSSNNSNR